MALTIEHVLDRFSTEGSGTALREALSSVAEHESSTPLDNDSYADALLLTEAMFLKTNRSINILTGNGSNEFLAALSSSFEGALKRIRKVGGKVRVILLDTEDQLGFAEKYSDVVECVHARVTGDKSIRHLIICDDNKLRDEEPHNSLTKASLASEIKANVYLNAPVNARMKTVYFNSLWDKLTGEKK